MAEAIAGGLPANGDILIPEPLPLTLDPKLDAESTLKSYKRK